MLSGIIWRLKGRELGQQPRGHVGENELIDVERQKVQEGEEGMPSSKSSRGERDRAQARAEGPGRVGAGTPDPGEPEGLEARGVGPSLPAALCSQGSYRKGHP